MLDVANLKPLDVASMQGMTNAQLMEHIDLHARLGNVLLEAKWNGVSSTDPQRLEKIKSMVESNALTALRELRARNGLGM